MGVASLVLGIISIVCCIFSGAWYIAIPGAILGIVAIILGGMGRKDPSQKGLATAGLVCGIVGTCLCLVFFISCQACLCIAEDNVRSSFGF